MLGRGSVCSRVRGSSTAAPRRRSCRSGHPWPASTRRRGAAIRGAAVEALAVGAQATGRGWSRPREDRAADGREGGLRDDHRAHEAANVRLVTNSLTLVALLLPRCPHGGTAAFGPP